MGNLEEMEKLQAKSKVFPIDVKEGVTANLEIHPLGLDDMKLLSAKEDMSMAEMSENAKKLISVSLKIPEDNVKMDIKFMEDVMNAIMNLNGFDKEDMKKTGIKTFIDKKKEQLANEKSS
jgi:hypothetical protein